MRDYKKYAQLNEMRTVVSVASFPALLTFAFTPVTGNCNATMRTYFKLFARLKPSFQPLLMIVRDWADFLSIYRDAHTLSDVVE